jgi:hypothetical protein
MFSLCEPLVDTYSTSLIDGMDIHCVVLGLLLRCVQRLSGLQLFATCTPSAALLIPQVLLVGPCEELGTPRLTEPTPCQLAERSSARTWESFILTTALGKLHPYQGSGKDEAFPGQW